MNTYDFTIFVSGRFDDVQDEQLIERCPDVIECSSCGDVSRVGFLRDAVDLESAIRSALADLSALGHRPTKAEIETDTLAAS